MPGRRLIESPPPAASSSDEEMEEGEEVASSISDEREAAQDDAVMEQNGEGDSSEEDEEDDDDEEDLLGEYPSILSLLECQDLTEGAKERAIMLLRNVEEEKLMELEREGSALMQAKLELLVKEKALVEKVMTLALDASKSQDH